MSLIIISARYNVVDLENLALSHRPMVLYNVYSLQLEDALSPHLLQLGKVLQGWRNRHIRALSPHQHRRYDPLVKSTVYIHGVLFQFKMMDYQQLLLTDGPRLSPAHQQSVQYMYDTHHFV